MRVLGCILVAALLVVPLPAVAYDILVVQSLREKGYEEAVNGLRRECDARMRVVILSDYAEADITRLTREEHPRLVVAVGDRALEVTGNLRGTPLIYMMALNPRPGRRGVEMLLDPVRYLAVFNNLGSRKIGVVYDPKRSGGYVRRALAAARRGGVELVLREVRAAKETPAALESLRGKVDALWMLPDATAVSPASTEAYFLFSQSQRVPVVTFAEAYLAMGAAVALTIDRFDIGRQLGEMARSVLEGTPAEEIASQPPRRALPKSNDAVLRRLKGTHLGGI